MTQQPENPPSAPPASPTSSPSSGEAAAEAGAPTVAAGIGGIRLRAVLLALALVPLNAFALLHGSVVRARAFPTSFALFGNVVGFLALILPLNALLKRFFPRAALNTGDLIVCYVLLCLASAASNDQTCFLLVNVISHVAWFSNPTNNWQELFGNDLPAWLVAQDREALKGYYIGVSSFWRPEHLAVWLPPLGWWLAFLLVLVGVMLCINAIVRKPWMDAQRLTFPIVTLPTQLVSARSDLWRSRLFWAGVAITVVLDLVNGLHMLYPALPEIPRTVNVALFFGDQRPWNAFPAWRGAEVPIGIYPFIFGLGLLMPLDLVFSCWFLYLMTRFAAVAQAARGLDNVPGFPFSTDQASGAFLGISLFLLWQLRGHLRAVLRKALWNDPAVDDRREPLSYRAAVLGLVAGFAFLLVFANKMGMSLAVAAALFIGYLLLGIGITRMRAEAGITSHDMYLGGPDVLLINLFGAARFAKPDLIAMSLLYGINRAYDAHPMPQQLEGMKLGERGGMNLRGLAGIMLLGTAAGVIASFLVMPTVMYQLGAASGKVVDNLASEPWNRLGTWIASPPPPNGIALTYRGIGGVVAVGLLMLRYKGIWCPLHPVGIAMTGSWYMFRIWSTLLFAWLVKALVLRYGGRRQLEALIQFGLGLILGDCVLGCFWAVVGASFNIPTFNVWP